MKAIQGDREQGNEGTRERGNKGREAKGQRELNRRRFKNGGTVSILGPQAYTATSSILGIDAGISSALGPQLEGTGMSSRRRYTLNCPRC